MLEVEDLRVFHGRIEAVHGISFSVGEGACVALLGPNGAGKTSTISAICGVARSRGSVRLGGEDISALAAEDRIRRGIAVAPEGRRVFSNLTVLENLLMGGAVRADRAAVRRDIDGWLAAFPILAERRFQPAGTLSGGEQQMLTIARALMGAPRILLLDEPSLGLAPMVCRRVFGLVEDLKRRGTTILLVEQNVRQAMRLADRAHILSGGTVVAEGSGAELGADEALMAGLAGIG